MTIYRDDYLPETGRTLTSEKNGTVFPGLGHSAYLEDSSIASDPIVCVNHLIHDLYDFDDIERVMPKALSFLAPFLRMYSVTLIESYNNQKNLRVWFDSETPLSVVRETLQAARDNYRNCVDAEGDFGSDQSHPQLLGGVFSGLIPLFQATSANRIVLPLVVGHGPAFGVLQIETEQAVQADEKILAMLNVFANQIASGIERDSFIHYQRKLMARQYSANVKLTELEQQRVEAVAASTAKSSFLANMSHEIRTPLGIILGFSELLGTKEIAPAERNLFQNTIKKNGQLLAKLIDDILDLSKIEEGKIELEFKNFSLSELLHDIETTFTTRAQEKGLYFKIIRDEEIPEYISSDPFRLKQILINLVNNALKFTDAGGITLSVKQKGSVGAIARPTNRLLRFEIHDTGLGIHPDEAKRLFQPFTQASTTTHKKYGGTGLGLVLARRLANALGGDVILRESMPGEGSTFEVTIGHPCVTAPRPLTHVEVEEEVEAPTWNTLEGSRVLIADDALDNLLLFSTVLRAHGAIVDTAVNGMEAVEKALRNSYDIILLDLQMPLKDGFTAAGELRDSGYKKPILALTAMAMAEERAKAIQAGCDDHLSKPVNAEMLVQKIAKLAGHSYDTKH